MSTIMDMLSVQAAIEWAVWRKAVLPDEPLEEADPVRVFEVGFSTGYKEGAKAFVVWLNEEWRKSGSPLVTSLRNEALENWLKSLSEPPKED